MISSRHCLNTCIKLSLFDELRVYKFNQVIICETKSISTLDLKSWVAKHTCSRKTIQFFFEIEIHCIHFICLKLNSNYLF